MWPGRHVVICLMLKVMPQAPATTATGVFQVGVSRDPAAVRSCLRRRLAGESGGRKPDRVINGVRCVEWSNGDAGMSQAIGACYAVERFTVSESASGGDPSVTLPEARGAAERDATVASLDAGNGPAQAPTLRMPPGALAR